MQLCQEVGDVGRALALSDKLVDLYGMGGCGSKRRRMASTVATLAERAQRVAASGLPEAQIETGEESE